MMRDKPGVVGDVHTSIRKYQVGPPIDPIHIQRCFGGLKGFEAVDELVTIVTGGAPVNATATVLSSTQYSMAITAVSPSICQQSRRNSGKTQDVKKA